MARESEVEALGNLNYDTFSGSRMLQVAEGRQMDHQCTDCGAPGATLGEDPYAAEIHQDYTLVWMCDDCRHESLMDI